MNYNQTIIIEANYKDRINNSSKSNDFTVRVPAIVLKKGTTIELSGSIVQEVSANSDSVIELSNQNLSSSDPYTSSWSSIETRYYINNNGYNSIVFPFIQTNYTNQTEGLDPTGAVMWQQNEIFPNNSSYVHANRATVPNISKLSGPGINTSQRYDFQFDNANIYTLRQKMPFLRFDGSIQNLPSTYWGGWTNGEMENGGYNDVIPPPYDLYGVLGHGEITNFDMLSGMVGIRTALKKNAPDGSKFTYIKPGYLGPTTYDLSEESGIPDMEIYTRNIEINLKNDLMETPQEISLLINEQLQGNRYKIPDNNINVKSKFRQWSSDYLKEYSNDLGLYPENSEKVIPNITSDTLINIRANWQNDQQHSVFGESFFVKDAERWVYGNSFFKQNKKYTKLTDNSYTIVKGIDPIIMRPYISDFDSVWRGAGSGSSLPSTEFPATLAMSMIHNEPIYTPFTDDLSTPNVRWDFLHGETPPFLPGATFPGKFMLFLNLHPDGTLVSENKEFLYGVNWVYNNYIDDKYFLCSHSENSLGQLEMIFYDADIINNQFVQTSPVVVFKIDLSIENVYNKSEINVIYDNKVYKMQNQNVIGADPIPLTFVENSTYNGLPYYEMESCTGGGQYGTDNIDDDPIVDEYLALPDKFIIPMNVRVYTETDDLSIVLDRIKNFFRNNETYIGLETDLVKMNADKLNWYCDLDIGMASDFLNAYSNWLSSRGKDNPTEDTTDYTIYNEEQNFSIYPKYYPNMMSNKQYDFKTPGTNGYNFRRPLTIYPISRYARMGQKYQNTENYIRVYSRFNMNIINNSTATNHNMGLNFNETATAKRLHPLIKVFKHDKIIEKYCELNDISLVGIQYHGSTDMSYGFINFKNTCSGNLEDNVSYDNLSLPNRRQCFRVCAGCNIGFDVSSTTNPYASAVNRSQSVPTNGNYFVREFFGTRNQTTTDLEVGTYSYGEIASPIYSPRVEDYINYIYIGATAPILSFENNRMSWSNLYTPRRFNSSDALPGDPNIGGSICYLNDQTKFFNCLNCTTGTVPDFGTVTNNVPARGQPGFYQLIKSDGIIDSLSGVGIQNLYVRDELSQNILPNQKGVYKSIINIDGSTENYYKSLWWLLGFRLKQFQPVFGKSYNRYSAYTYNKFDKRKYDGLNYFTLNSLVNQSAMQLINIFGPNYLSTDPVPVVDPLYPQSIQAQPEFMLSYVGFQPMNIQVSSDELRALNITSKLQQSFYKVVSNLPTGSYITNNNDLSCMGYMYRQYKNSSFYFSYAQGSNFTLTEDVLLTSIRTQILAENNRPAEHLGDSSVMFYKIIIPSVLINLDKEDLQEYVEEEKKMAMGGGGIVFDDPLTPVQEIQYSSIISQNISNPVDIMDDTTSYIDEMLGNPEYLLNTLTGVASGLAGLLPFPISENFEPTETKVEPVRSSLSNPTPMRPTGEKLLKLEKLSDLYIDRYEKLIDLEQNPLRAQKGRPPKFTVDQRKIINLSYRDLIDQAISDGTPLISKTQLIENLLKDDEIEINEKYRSRETETTEKKGRAEPRTEARAIE